MTENALSPAAAPTFDVAALLRLSSDVDDAAFVQVFAARYRQMLSRRVDRISDALLTEDVATALDATLSLKVSSSTVGTYELAGLALVIEDNVRRLDVEGARSVAARLPNAAVRADMALAEYLSA